MLDPEHLRLVGSPAFYIGFRIDIVPPADITGSIPTIPGSIIGVDSKTGFFNVQTEEGVVLVPPLADRLVFDSFPTPPAPTSEIDLNPYL